MIPFEVFHVASLGIDTLLGAIAYGARQVDRSVDGKGRRRDMSPRCKRQMSYAQTILNALGFAGPAFLRDRGASARVGAAAGGDA